MYMFKGWTLDLVELHKCNQVDNRAERKQDWRLHLIDNQCTIVSEKLCASVVCTHAKFVTIEMKDGYKDETKTIEMKELIQLFEFYF